jgi:Protein of unknown function (DUF3775)
MLTISNDRIASLLDKALDVEVPDIIAEDDDEVTLEDLSAALEEALSGDPAFRALAAAVGELSTDEAYELLAVAQIGEEDDDEPPDFDDALARVRAAVDEPPASGLLQILLMTDAIESGLERLGYAFDDEDEPDEDDES